MTHTYVIMELSSVAYDEIRSKLDAAHYDQAFHRQGTREVLDMHGIAVARAEEPQEPCATLSTWRRRQPRLEEVLAARIKVAIVLSPIVERTTPTDHDVTIVLESGAEIGVPKTFIAYGIPSPGDYFIRKESGLQTWVSGKMFEAQFMQM